MNRPLVIPVAGYDAAGRQLGLALADAQASLERPDMIQAYHAAASHRGPQRRAETWGIIIPKDAPEWIENAARRIIELRLDNLRHNEPLRAPSARSEQRDWLDEVVHERWMPTTALILAPPSRDGVTLELESWLATGYGVVTGRLWFEDDLLRRIFGADMTQRRAVDNYIRRLEALEDGGIHRDGGVVVSHPYAVDEGDRPQCDAMISALVPELDGVNADRILRREPAPSLVRTLGARPPRVWVHLGGALHVPDDLRRGSLYAQLPVAREGAVQDDELVTPDKLVGVQGRVAAILGCYTGGTSDYPLTVPGLKVLHDISWHPDDLKATGELLDDAEEHRARRSHASGLVHALLAGEDGFGAVVAGYDQLFHTSFDGTHKYAVDPWLGLLNGLTEGPGYIADAFRQVVNHACQAQGGLFPKFLGGVSDSNDHVWTYLSWANLVQMRVFGDPLVRTGC